MKKKNFKLILHLEVSERVSPAWAREQILELLNGFKVRQWDSHSDETHTMEVTNVIVK